MKLIAALIAAFALAQGSTFPPPYPRAGTTSLIDNERVQVWDVTWPKTAAAPLMHRHLYDMTGVYYWPGDRMITSTDGTKRPVHTDAGRIQWQLKGVTHIEEGASDDPLSGTSIHATRSSCSRLRKAHARGSFHRARCTPPMKSSTARR